MNFEENRVLSVSNSLKLSLMKEDERLLQEKLFLKNQEMVQERKAYWKKFHNEDFSGLIGCEYVTHRPGKWGNIAEIKGFHIGEDFLKEGKVSSYWREFKFFNKNEALKFLEDSCDVNIEAMKQQQTTEFENFFTEKGKYVFFGGCYYEGFFGAPSDEDLFGDVSIDEFVLVKMKG